MAVGTLKSTSETAQVTYLLLFQPGVKDSFLARLGKRDNEILPEQSNENLNPVQIAIDVNWPRPVFSFGAAGKGLVSSNADLRSDRRRQRRYLRSSD